MRFYFT